MVGTQETVVKGRKEGRKEGKKEGREGGKDGEDGYSEVNWVLCPGRECVPRAAPWENDSAGAQTSQYFLLCENKEQGGKHNQEERPDGQHS